jgi:hypothetical protein
MTALIVPLSLVRSAVSQSQHMGIDETRSEVVDRVLGHLRTTHHPAVRTLYALRDYQSAAAAPNGDQP